MDGYPQLTGDVVAVVLFFIGLFGVVVRKNMMLTVIATSIMNTAIVLFFVTINASPGMAPPMVGEVVAQTADPIPQALMITSVVIGVSVQAVALVLVMNLFKEYGTLDWAQAKLIRERRP